MESERGLRQKENTFLIHFHELHPQHILHENAGKGLDYHNTRNTHAHLCLAPVRRLRARVLYASVVEARVARVTFANLL